MSVDLSRLSAHLPADQQAAVRRAYRQQAKSATTAFLLCFFLGIFGAHAFYLGRTGQGILRLMLSPLIIPGLIWELIDLFHIDHDVYEQNLKVAEDLVAQALLAVPNTSLEAEALARLDALVHERETHAAPPASAAQEAAGPAVLAAVTEPISAGAGAHTLAEIDPSPEPVVPAPPIWPIAEDAEAYHTEPTGGTAATARDAVPYDAEQTPAVHLEPLQPAPDAGPVWASWPAPQAAQEVYQTADVADHNLPSVDADGRGAATLDALTGPDGASDDSDITAAMVAFAAALADEEAPLVLGESPAGAMHGFAVAAEREPTGMPISVDDAHGPAPDERLSSEADAAATRDASPRGPRRAADLTDSVPAPDAPPLADVGEGPGAPVRVRLPQPAAAIPESAAAASWAAPPVAETAPQPWNEPTGEFAAQDAAGGFAAADGAVEDAPLDMPPDADLESSTLVLVADDEGDAPARAGETPSTLAELAASAPVWATDLTPAAAAAAGTAYESHITEVVGDHEAETTKRIVKRVRVVRRLVVNGQVVHEATAEQVVDADADTDATARTLQATLGSADPQRLASLATQEHPEDATGPANGPGTAE